MEEPKPSEADPPRVLIVDDSPKNLELAGELLQVRGFDVLYAPGGQEALDCAEKEVLFQVRDNGPGLTEEDKEKLFGRFQSLSAQPTGGEPSTGLGLAIVKRLVELHRGHVWVESEHGKGATFCIGLPSLLADEG